MGKNINKNYISLGIVFTVSVCICITFSHILNSGKAIFAVLGKIWSALTPFTIGIILAFLLNPVMEIIRKGICMIYTKITKNKDYDYDKIYRASKIPALILTMILFFSALVGFLWLVIPKIYQSLTDLVENIPIYIDNAQLWIEKTFSGNKLIGDKFNNIMIYVEDNVLKIFTERIMPNLDTIVVNISTGVVVGLKAILNILVGFIVTVYLLASKDVLLAQGKKIICCIFSKKRASKILEGLSYANSVFGGFINGKILDSIIIGIICFVFTSAVGMKYAVLISVIVGITNIIPFFGPFIGAVPGALLAVMDDPIMLIVFVVWIIILQQFDGNILGPLILGDSTGLSGVWVLLSIIVAGDLFGVAGMILGVPVFACIYAFIAVMLRDGLRKKQMSSITADYVRLKGFDEKTGEPLYREHHERRRIKKRRQIKKEIKKSGKKNDDTL